MDTVYIALLSALAFWAVCMGIFKDLATSTAATLLYTTALIGVEEGYRAWFRWKQFHSSDMRELISEIRQLKEAIQQLKGDKPDEDA